MNCLFGLASANWARLGIVSAGAEIAGLGASQVQGDHGSSASAWRTPPGVVSSWLQVDAGAVVAWGAFGIFNTNLTPAATLRWQLSGSPTNWATGLLYDSGTLAGQVVAGYRQALHVPPAPVAARYFRVTINDGGNAEGFLRVAQLFAGSVIRPARNFGYSSSLAREVAAAVVVTRGGQEFTDYRHARRSFALSLPSMPPADVWRVAQAVSRDAEAGGNVLFAPMPEGADLAREAVFGRLTTESPVTYPGRSSALRAWSATIAERL